MVLTQYVTLDSKIKCLSPQPIFPSKPGFFGIYLNFQGKNSVSPTFLNPNLTE
jgi:hypothetical protein